jgi:hypothetical protein
VNLVQLRGVWIHRASLRRAPFSTLFTEISHCYFVVNGSRLYALNDAAVPPGADEIEELGSSVTVAEVVAVPSALSLKIAQCRNLTCWYCYTDEGRFGGGATLMPLEIALEAVRRHIWGSRNGPVSVGFIGDEPLLNRVVLHAATHHAADAGCDAIRGWLEHFALSESPGIEAGFAETGKRS